MEERRRGTGSPRLAVIGLDGTDPQTLRQYIAEGRLPTIARILSASREIEVRTDGELFLNSPWPSFASGLSVASHGIHAFRPLRSGTMELVEGADFRMPAPFWEIAARSGIATAVLDVPLYGPPLTARGLEQLHYVEWGPHPPLRPPASFPPRLTPLLTDRHGPHPCTSDVESLPTVEDAADMVARLRAGARTRAAVIADVIRMTDPELFVATFSELHTAAHQWAHAETPNHRCYDATLVRTLGSPLRDVYEAVDDALERVVERLPPETTVLLTCLGGFRVTHGGSYLLHDLLTRLGLAAWTGEPFRVEDPASWRRYPEAIRTTLRRWRAIRTGQRPFESPEGLYFDWSKTSAFALTWAYDGYLRLNQRRREPGGIVANGAERTQLLTTIESAIHALRLAGTDEPAARAVVRAQEQFPGPASHELPDLMVLWNNAHPFGAVESDTVGRIENRDPAQRCAHGSRGGVFAQGPLVTPGPIARGIRDFDLAPTILKLLGVEIPRGLDGRVVAELITTATPKKSSRTTSPPSVREHGEMVRTPFAAHRPEA